MNSLAIFSQTLCKALHKCHNHPSGTSQPSEADITSVVSLKHKADMFEFTYIDDLVITKKGHYSFAENGLVIGLGEH